jgi:hypothetical protein
MLLRGRLAEAERSGPDRLIGYLLTGAGAGGGRGAFSNAPFGPGNTTGLSQPSAVIDETPKNQSSITTSFSVVWP